MPRVLRAMPLVCAAGLAAGCVTESISPVRPVGVASAPAGLRAPPPRTEPFATALNLSPLGAVRYDGVHLPLASPDARFIAVASGLPPDDAAALAAPGASPPVGSAPRRYDLGSGRPEPIDPAGQFDGLLLGRSADDRGVLVEWPRPDGARWIGSLPWGGGPPQWRVDGPHVNAFAIATDPTTVIFCRRPADEPNFAIVERRNGEDRTVFAVDDESLVFPAVSPDRSLLAAVRLSVRGLELSVFTLGADGWTLRYSQPLGVPATMEAASAVFEAMEPCPGPSRGGALDGIVLARSPADGQAVVVTSSGIALLGVLVESVARAESIEPGAVIHSAAARTSALRIEQRHDGWRAVSLVLVSQRRLAACNSSGGRSSWILAAPGETSERRSLDLARLDVRQPVRDRFRGPAGTDGQSKGRSE